MLPLPHERPDSSHAGVALGLAMARDIGGLTTRAHLVLNVRAKGRWATWFAPSSAAGCGLRPGVLNFQGEADDWLARLPRYRENESDDCFHRLDEALAPLLVPVPNDRCHGVLVLDYDHRQVLSAQTAVRADAVTADAWNYRISPIEPWLCHLIESGHLPWVREAGSGKRYRLPAPGQPEGNPWWWLNVMAGRALRQDGADTGRTAAVFEFEFHKPGWDLLEVGGRDEARAIQTLGHCLAPHELQAWADWSRLGQGWKIPEAAFLAALGQARMAQALPESRAGGDKARPVPARL